MGWQQNFNLKYVYCATSTQVKLPSKVTWHVLQADQRNVNSMAKYGSQLRYLYVMLELMNSSDEDELPNCERVSLLKTIKSGWANGLMKKCFCCKLCGVFFK